MIFRASSWRRTSGAVRAERSGESRMDRVEPWIVSKTLADALEQIRVLRIRVKEATTYDGAPLTSPMRASFLTMLDEIERNEVISARQREEERLRRAKQRAEIAIKQRSAALTEIATAIDWLTDGVSKLLKNDIAAVDAAREAGTEVPNIKSELQKLAQAGADAIRSLTATAESAIGPAIEMIP
jgi:hypothetical protein